MTRVGWEVAEVVVEVDAMEVEVMTEATAGATVGEAATSLEGLEVEQTRGTIRGSPSTGGQVEDTATPALPGAVLEAT